MKRLHDLISYNFKGFVVLMVLTIIFGVIFLSGFNDTGKVNASTSNQKYFVCVDIQDGDTLWSIADLYITEEYSSVDDYIEEIKELNGLSNDKILCGATLVVPYYAP